MATIISDPISVRVARISVAAFALCAIASGSVLAPNLRGNAGAALADSSKTAHSAEVANDPLLSPIPLHSDVKLPNFHLLPVDLSQPLSQEPLVKLSDVGLSSKSYYYINDGTNAPYNERIPGSLPDVWLRKTVAQKLMQVNQDLASHGVEVHVYDGYRTIETQQALWEHFIREARKQLKTDDPKKLEEFAAQFCSHPSGFDPKNPVTWQMHNTGGAVDLTLEDKKSGKLVDMGSGFDEASEITYTDALERQATSDHNSAAHGRPATSDHNSAAHGRPATSDHNSAALNNRRLLFNAMKKEGFENYPYEWWHYEWGTQMWLRNSGQAASGNKAWYGPARLP